MFPGGSNGVTRSRWYDSDPELEIPRLAAESIVLKLGEAVRRLPPDFLDTRAGDPVWRRAIGMRNRIAHEYDAVDHEIVWQVLARQAGQLRATVDEILAEDPLQRPGTAKDR